MPIVFDLDKTLGISVIKDRVDPFALPEYLIAPLPTYVSLQSALYLHARP